MGAKTAEQPRVSGRAARRARQRAENPARAAQMHAARLAWERASHPDVPADTPAKQLHVGCSGWFYWHWAGTFYPPELKTGGWFRHYADRFDTVELNAPFYSWPTVATVKS